MPQLRLVIVDDHPAILRGVAASLREYFRDAGITTCATAQEAAELAPRPEIALLDLQLADDSVPAENVRLLHDVGCEVLLYTQETRRTLGSACFRAGASGIVGKNDELEELVEALRCLQAGEPYLSSDWAAALDDDQARIPNLTPREADALRLYATGLPLKSVARRMEVGEQTAREYLLRARKKYTEVGRPADTRTDLYIRAVEDGRLPGPEPL